MLKRASFASPRTTLSVIFAALALGATPLTASATQTASQPASLAPVEEDVALERVFWECDYTATIRMFDPNEAATCSWLSEELKARKFQGDFEQMLAWWSANKSAEHRKVAERVDGRLG